MYTYTEMNERREKIIFYDGECGLCQRSIAFLAGQDHQKILHFAPLNGVTYQHYLRTPAKMETVLYFNGESLSAKSNAVINCLFDLGGKWKWIKLLKLIPLFIRDNVYDLIANNRKKVSCPILRRDDRFLK